jgi:hypothetical protein
VFKKSFELLETANTQLGAINAAGTLTIAGDIYFNNDLKKWQKAVNAYRLRLLIHLSKKVDDPELQVKQQFAAITSDPNKYPLMTSSSDNLQYNYIFPPTITPKTRVHLALMP